jgi:predicted MFS family arabinose efflux permease
MAIFVNSWPAGIGAALIILPSIGADYGAPEVFLVTALVLIGAFIALAALYAPPPHVSPLATSTPQAGKIDRDVRRAVIFAGTIWGLYNTGFAIVFSFGPLLLTELGWTLAAAGSAASFVLWMALASVPLGGILADRTGRPDAILLAGCLSSALLMVFATRIDPLLLFVALGLCGGLPAGAIMSMPARVLEPSTRAVGMGIFYTVFYPAMAVGPIIGGWIATRAGTAYAAFTFGAAALAACAPLLLLFRRSPRLAIATQRSAG